MTDLSDLTSFVAVARAGGFREAARGGDASASSLSEAALDVIDGFRDRPAGTLRLNVPVSATIDLASRGAPGFLPLIR